MRGPVPYRCRTFLLQRRTPPSWRCRPPAAEANLPTRYPTHRRSKPDVLVPPAAAREPLRLAPGAQPRALGAARARRRREVLDPDRRQFAAPSRLRRFAAPIQLGAKIEPDRSWSNNAALTVGSLARDRNRHSRFPDAEQRRGHKMRLCRRQLRWEPAGTANKCLANGPAAYDVLPEDANEKNYRPKRSDKFKGQSVLDEDRQPRWRSRRDGRRALPCR